MDDFVKIIAFFKPPFKSIHLIGAFLLGCALFFLGLKLFKIDMVSYDNYVLVKDMSQTYILRSDNEKIVHDLNQCRSQLSTSQTNCSIENTLRIEGDKQKKLTEEVEYLVSPGRNGNPSDGVNINNQIKYSMNQKN